MEEGRTKKHRLGLALSVRRGKFGHFSGILCICGCHELYSNKISTQLSGTLTHPYALADPASGSTGPNSSFSSCLSLTVAFPWLSLTTLCFALEPCLSLSFSGLIGNLTHKPFVWVLHQNRQRNPRTGAHPHPQNECPSL